MLSAHLSLKYPKRGKDNGTDVGDFEEDGVFYTDKTDGEDSAMGELW